jgi:hypothetical protein
MKRQGNPSNFRTVAAPSAACRAATPICQSNSKPDTLTGFRTVRDYFLAHKDRVKFEDVSICYPIPSCPRTAIIGLTIRLCPFFRMNLVERVKGIEPSSSAWKGGVYGITPRIWRARTSIEWALVKSSSLYLPSLLKREG